MGIWGLVRDVFEGLGLLGGWEGKSRSRGWVALEERGRVSGGVLGRVREVAVWYCG